MDARIAEATDAALDAGSEPVPDAEAGIDASSQLDAAIADAAPSMSDAASEGGDDSGAACGCASEGSWSLENIAPCVFVGEEVWMYSSKLVDGGLIDCGTSVTEPPTPPTATWSESSVELACTGDFELCWEILAGSYLEPKPSDCAITRACTSFSYDTPGVRMTLPDLPSWVSDDLACNEAFYTIGGYGRATLKAAIDACGKPIRAESTPDAFHVINYCRPACVSTPDAPECMDCDPSI